MFAFNLKKLGILFCFFLVTRNLSLAPIQPNGHFFINKIILASESQMQLLVPPSITPQSGGMGKYSMRIAEFSIEYHVADCGYGMELIQSSGPNANRVMISRVSLWLLLQ